MKILILLKALFRRKISLLAAPIEYSNPLTLKFHSEVFPRNRGKMLTAFFIDTG